jgi:hypothetical protein
VYQIINDHIDPILATITDYHVNEYDWLVANIAHVANDEYQRRYRKYWVMNPARLSDEFYESYFNLIEGYIAAPNNPPLITTLTNDLYQIPTHKKGKQSVQFSFASKLLHMIDHHSPIYDDLIASFYFWEPPDQKQPEQRIQELGNFHQFLCQEFGRILKANLLQPAITAFRRHFPRAHFTDTKIIDSLIWSFVAWLRNGAIIEGKVAFH